MPSTTYGSGDERPLGVAPASPEADRPDVQDVSSTEDIDIGWWEKALSDAERAEKPWRARGRDIVQIYRGDIPITRPKGGKYNSGSSYGTKQDTASAFNILYANTEVMLPAAYSKPPDPVVKSRFIKKTADQCLRLRQGWDLRHRAPACRALPLRALVPREHRACR